MMGGCYPGQVNRPFAAKRSNELPQAICEPFASYAASEKWLRLIARAVATPIAIPDSKTWRGTVMRF
jgi:hypothetical protein